MNVCVEPIRDAQVGEVAAFLHTRLNPRVPAAAWAATMQRSWGVAAPNHGFLLRAGTDVVGAYLALYSQRPGTAHGRPVCNLAAWCVLPDHRAHSVRLLRAVLRQQGWVFTDLSPSGAVVPLNERLGFVRVDTTTSLVPCLPWPTLPARVRLRAGADAVRPLLSPEQRVVLDDHAHAAAAHHVVLEHGGRRCWVVYRRDRRKGLPLFASLLHVSDPEVFAAGLHRFARHLLVRGVPVLLLEERLVGGYRPAVSRRLRSPRPKMLRGEGFGPGDLPDYLYSELATVAW